MPESAAQPPAPAPAVAKGFGHGEINLDHAEVVQRGDGGAVVQHLPLDQIGQSDDAVKVRAQGAILDGDTGAVAFGLGAKLGGARGLQRRVRRTATAVQLFLAVQCGVGLGQGRLGGGKIGLFGAVVQCQQDIALRHLGAGLERDAGDAAAGLGDQIDGVAGTRGAHRAHGVGECRHRHRDRVDRDGLSRGCGGAVGLGIGGGQKAVGQGQAQHTGTDHDDGPQGRLDETHQWSSPVWVWGLERRVWSAGGPCSRATLQAD